LIQIPYDIFDLFQSYRKADQVVGDSAGGGLTVANGCVLQSAPPRKIGFGELAAKLDWVGIVGREGLATPATEWQAAGTSLPKINARELVNGRHKYTSDHKLPGMLYGRVLRPPSFGAKLVSVDTTRASKIAGVTVVRDGDFVGVAASDEQKAEKAGAQSLEACMASSITQARQGTLYLMCGGRPEAFERARLVLVKLSNALRYIGTSGKAAQVKALVNMVMNINTAGLAEGLGLGEALGLDLTMLREVFSQTGADSRVLRTDGEDMQKRDHECFFSAAHAAKDSGIAFKLAQAQGLNLPLAVAAKKQFGRMVVEGLGELDKSGVAELTFKGRHQGKA